MNIRKLKQTELSQVMQIWLEANLEVHDFVLPGYWKRNTGMVRALMERAEIYVAETEDTHRVMGFIGLMGDYVAGLFVHAAHRSEGVGKALIDYAKHYKTYLVLRVFCKNRRAIEFYRREGFAVAKEQTDADTREAEYEMIWEK